MTLLISKARVSIKEKEDIRSTTLRIFTLQDQAFSIKNFYLQLGNQVQNKEEPTQELKSNLKCGHKPLIN